MGCGCLGGGVGEGEGVISGVGVTGCDLNQKWTNRLAGGGGGGGSEDGENGWRRNPVESERVG